MTWLRLILLWIILTVVAYGINFFIPRISSYVSGKGFNDTGSPFYQWSNFENKLLDNGMSELKNLSKTNVFFLAIYGLMEFVVHNTLLSLIAGLYAFFMLGALKRNDFGLRMMASSIKPAFRFAFGLWFVIILLLFAGLIGAVEQIYYYSQSSPDSLSMLAAWSLAGSVVVIALCVLFIRLSPLPYVRAESSERFVDSIRYAFHLTSANFWFIIIMLAPFVVGSFVLFHYTRSIPVVSTVTQQFGILMVIVVESCVYNTLTTFKESAKTNENALRLG
ncbi:MAG: hypothetical protein KA140_05755 [Caldisericia bacterium]|nr:hypothetical protein [Caldisericia bacterium]